MTIVKALACPATEKISDINISYFQKNDVVRIPPKDDGGAIYGDMSTLPIVCLTQVWQSLLPLFCDKTFEFAIQTWQNSLEHYYVYVQTYFLSQLLKMLILLISSYCKMCTLPTLRSRVFVCCEQYKHARSYCLQWTHFTMGPINEQNQHFA